MRLRDQLKTALHGVSGGMTLLEVVIAMALISIIAVALLGGLATANTVVVTADMRTTAESLARSQMEYVKRQTYSPPPWSYEVTHSGVAGSEPLPDWWNPDDPDNPIPPALPEEHAGYTVEVTAVLLRDGIHKVKIVVLYGSRYLLTLEGYNF